MRVRTGTPDRLELLERGEVARFVLSGELLICCSATASRRGCAVALSESAWRNLSIDSFLKSVEEHLGEMPPIEFKAMGPAAALRNLEDELQRHKITLKSKAAREEIGIEVFYYPENGRVRIEAPALSTAGKNTRTSPTATDLSPKPTIPSPSSQKTRVLIVDDSATIRKLLSNVFATDPTIEVVATAERPSQVEALIKTHRPNVITLDIHMPEMDGVTLLKQIHPKYGIPTVMISSTSMEEGRIVLDALESGAIDYVQKPSLQDLPVIAPIILEKVKAAATAQIRRSSNTSTRPTRTRRTLTTSAAAGNQIEQTLIVIGSSTGGTEALKDIFVSLPDQIPPILVVQHIPAIFSKALADRLNGLCPFEVKEAQDGDAVQANRVLIAPGGKQMKLNRSGGKLLVQINDDAPMNRHKPSVDYLFDSVLKHMAPNTLGVILTGMGADGARGLLKLKDAGAHTIAQDEASCVVFGMPREAIALGAATEVKSLDQIADCLMHLTAGRRKTAA